VNTQRKTILVMDDSPIALGALAAALGANNYDVRTAETLADLERHLESAKPDLFVIDVQMPEAYGDDIAQVLRAVRNIPAPIVLFSGLDDESLARRATEAGVQAWVSKNAGLEALIERIAALLAP
jgi:DNA-binding response OmpR family regulator